MTKDVTGWRYQAVYIKEKEFSICEVFIAKGKLAAWIYPKEIEPFGETLDDLLNKLHEFIDAVCNWRFLGEPIDEFIAELQRAMDDLCNWKPVRYNSLRGGMIFEPTELIKDDVVEKDDDEKDEKFLELEYFLESCWAKSKGVFIKDANLYLTLYPSEFKIKNDK